MPNKWQRLLAGGAKLAPRAGLTTERPVDGMIASVKEGDRSNVARVKQEENRMKSAGGTAAAAADG